jgi:hypothetical protein
MSRKNNYEVNEPYHGLFWCEGCDNVWTSYLCWIDYWQKCIKCDKENYAEEIYDYEYEEIYDYEYEDNRKGDKNQNNNSKNNQQKNILMKN